MDFLADEEDDFLTPKQQTNTKARKSGRGGLTSLFTKRDNTPSLAATETETGNDFKYRAPKKNLAASQGTEN